MDNKYFNNKQRAFDTWDKEIIWKKDHYHQVEFYEREEIFNSKRNYLKFC